MTPGRIVCTLAVLAVLCVLAVFFFPVMQGPYSAVHGPVTVLLSARAAVGLRAALSYAGLNVSPVWFAAALFLTFWAAGAMPESRTGILIAECNSLLRC
jgi:hypothetical protein